MSPSKQWLIVGTVLLGGVLAASDLGAVAPVVPQLGRDLRLDGLAAGWSTSVITGLAAVAGLPTGRWAQGHEPGRLFTGGLSLLALAGIATGWLSAGSWSLIEMRALSGVGYLLIIVIGPALLVHLVDEHRHSAVLGLWGLCIPAGLAVATEAGGLFAPFIGWRLWLAMPGICAGSLALVAGPRWFQTKQRQTPISQPGCGRTGWRQPALLAAGFALLTMIGVAVVTLLPTYLTAKRGLSGGEAGTLTALVAVTSVPASLLAGCLLRGRRVLRPLFLTSLAMPLGAAACFLLPIPLGARIGGAMLLLFANGLVVSAAYASIPAVASDRITIETTTGLLTQLGSAGTLIGPPLFTSIAASSPSLVPLAVLAVAIPGLGLLLLSTRHQFQD
jgi:MFS family permease